MTSANKYCAVYTRKSSDEGLEQEFNSLNAQREACPAYITSQKSEGWTAIKELYDDGGFSGGNMERPGLKKLLEDIQAGKVRIVVVYKIDRLTRSLMDFSKLVETFDAHGVTFVSVTQSFNTTTSMGRLTLNVLLSFAQFEREITAERIRDKFAASKKKGMWMGGTLPTGYGVENRHLYIKPEEVQFVRMLYEGYLKYGSVQKLRMHLESQGIKSPMRTQANGIKRGGLSMSNGALGHILKNPVYIGKIRHRKTIYDGLHQGVIPEELWNTVQEKIKNQSVPVRYGKRLTSEPQMLLGKVFDMEGNKYTPTYTKKKGSRYRYYISRALVKYGKHPKGVIARIPGVEIEEFVNKTLKSQLSDSRKFATLIGANHEQNFTILSHVTENHLNLSPSASVIKKVTVDVKSLTIEIYGSELCRYIEKTLKTDLSTVATGEDFRIVVPFYTSRSKKGAVVIKPGNAGDKSKDIFDMPRTELKNLIRGVVWRDEHFKGKTIRQIADRESLSEGFVGRLIHYSVEFQ